MIKRSYKDLEPYFPAGHFGVTCKRYHGLKMRYLICARRRTNLYSCLPGQLRRSPKR